MFCACVLKLNDDIIATPTFLHPRIRQRERCSVVKPSSRRNCLVYAKMVTLTRVRRAIGIAAGVDPKKAINRHSFSEEETPLYTACEYIIIRRRLVGIDPSESPFPSFHASICCEKLFNYHSYIRQNIQVI